MSSRAQRIAAAEAEAKKAAREGDTRKAEQITARLGRFDPHPTRRIETPERDRT